MARPAKASFASLRSELIVVEEPRMPIYEGGRLVNWTKGKSHHFHDHALTVEGVKSIEFIRERAKSPDGPGIYEMEHPDLEPVQDLLLELTTANVDRIREILTTERETAGRRSGRRGPRAGLGHPRGRDALARRSRTDDERRVPVADQDHRPPGRV